MMLNCDWWHGQSSRLLCCSYRLAGQPAWVQIFEYATKEPHCDPAFSPLLFFSALARATSASCSRRRIKRVGESAHLFVVPSGMPGNTVICPPTLTSSGRIG